MPATFGAFGDRLETARASHFFAWFQLAPEERESTSQSVRFRPSGPAFHDLTALDVATDAQGRIEQMTLVLARRFVDDPKDGAFAADIAASFIEAALGGAPALAPLVRALRYYMVARHGVIVRGEPGEMPALGELAPAFDVYRGQGKRDERRIGEQTLSLRNAGDPAQSSVEITVRKA